MTPIIVSLTFWASINATAPVKQVIPWDGSLLQCELFHQAEIAHWLEEHPSTTVIGPYRCTGEPSPGSVA